MQRAYLFPPGVPVTLSHLGRAQTVEIGVYSRNRLDDLRCIEPVCLGPVTARRGKHTNRLVCFAHLPNTAKGYCPQYHPSEWTPRRAAMTIAISELAGTVNIDSFDLHELEAQLSCPEGQGVLVYLSPEKANLLVESAAPPDRSLLFVTTVVDLQKIQERHLRKIFAERTILVMSSPERESDRASLRLTIACERLTFGMLEKGMVEVSLVWVDWLRLFGIGLPTYPVYIKTPFKAAFLQVAHGLAVKDQRDTAASERDGLERKLDEARNKIGKLEREKRGLEDERATARTRIEELEKDWQSSKTTIGKLERSGRWRLIFDGVLILAVAVLTVAVLIRSGAGPEGPTVPPPSSTRADSPAQLGPPPEVPPAAPLAESPGASTSPPATPLDSETATPELGEPKPTVRSGAEMGAREGELAPARDDEAPRRERTSPIGAKDASEDRPIPSPEEMGGAAEPPPVTEPSPVTLPEPAERPEPVAPNQTPASPKAGVQGAITAVGELATECFAEPGHRMELVGLLVKAMKHLAHSQEKKAKKDVANAIERVDGCILRGAPDVTRSEVRDWLVDCDAQRRVYELLDATLEELKT